METVHIGKGKDTLVEVPTPPKHLIGEAAKGYTNMGNILCRAGRLKEMFLPALEGWGDAYAQFVWACTEINRLNRKKMGSGYRQVYTTGAVNVSAEMVIRDRALDTMLKISKLFGLDPKSEKELKGLLDDSQTKMDFGDDFNKNRLAR